MSGRAVYAADVSLPGMLWAKILRSPHAHARIARIDVSKAARARGVRAVVTGADVKGSYVGKQIRDMPVLCWDVVRFVGDRVAAVAAESADAAEEALRLIEVDYEELPAVFDPLEAMKDGAPRIHESAGRYEGVPRDKLADDVRNGLTRLAWRKGDVEEGFRRADLVLEHSFSIPARHQGYIEPHACLVAAGGKRIQVWTSAKNPFGVRSQLAKAVSVPEERIVVHPVAVGGDFGGKGDAVDLPIAYHLSLRAGRPVKIVVSYAEELAAGNPAHPTFVTVRSGVTRDGRILARSLRAVHASGAYGALKANASLATWHYVGVPYRVEHSSFEFLQVYTNTVPGGYYRSPGAVATVFAIESHTDLIARELGIDPAEFRLRNLLGEGEEDAVGHRLCNVRFREVLRAALDAAGWSAPKPGPHWGRGIAISGRHIGGGDTGVVLTAESDGTLTVVSPTIDQGAGTHTVLRQLVAEAMHVAVDRVRVVVEDTDASPRDSGVRASRVTYVAGQAVLEACARLREELLRRAADTLECAVGDLEMVDGEFRLRQDPGQRVTLRRLVARSGGPLSASAHRDYPYPDDVSYVCAQVAEVEVDGETGAVRAARIVSAHDVGTVINPVTHQGQIDGAAVMGLGQGLMEELKISDGRVANANLGDYKLPTIADIPVLKTVLVESPGGVGPFEAKPIGEFANNGPPAALANAVADAVGVRLFELPLAAEKIYRALRKGL
ncbi:MAG TPA: xanthine dehydrogenase family protein molybdopterin-binding subunit [candidate division Zixibacteria bacterium]|nr:xanthine dehydrogenase family protein molybdopterin-binding subunit [candidate division Zixibacteria bacterium]